MCGNISLFAQPMERRRRWRVLLSFLCCSYYIFSMILFVGSIPGRKSVEGYGKEYVQVWQPFPVIHILVHTYLLTIQYLITYNQHPYYFCTFCLICLKDYTNKSNISKLKLHHIIFICINFNGHHIWDSLMKRLYVGMY